MHPQKIKNVLGLSGEERFHYFIRKVVDFEEIWGLYEKGWAMTVDSLKRKAIPFWPEKEFSSLCAEGSWENYQSKKIELDHFISRWLPGMEDDGFLVAIFPTPNNKGIVLTPNELLSYLENELEQYG